MPEKLHWVSQDSAYLSLTPDPPASSLVTPAYSPILRSLPIASHNWPGSHNKTHPWAITKQNNHIYTQPTEPFDGVVQTEKMVIGREGVQVKYCDNPFKGLDECSWF